MNKAKVISGFPGIGKSWLFDNLGELKILDSDSSNFSWVWKDGKQTDERHPEFPNNYMAHINQNLPNADAILVSSHVPVRDALVEAGIHFYLVAPKAELKAEFLQRYKDRGSPPKFIELLDENWEGWVTDLDNQKGCTLIRLDANQHLSDVFEQIMAD